MVDFDKMIPLITSITNGSAIYIYGNVRLSISDCFYGIHELHKSRELKCINTDVLFQ